MICKYWEKKKCKFMENSKLCTYAHGKDDLNRSRCYNYEKCYNENCLFKHTKGWNAFDNKLECLYYKNGDYCNKNNYKYKHIYESNDKNDDNYNIPKISITINGKNYDNKSDSDINDAFKNKTTNKEIKDNKEDETYENTLNICNTNIDWLSKYWEEHINAIKQNYSILYEKTNDSNLKTYYIQNQLLLNSFISNIKLFKENHHEIHTKINNNQ